MPEGTYVKEKRDGDSVTKAGLVLDTSGTEEPLKAKTVCLFSHVHNHTNRRGGLYDGCYKVSC